MQRLVNFARMYARYRDLPYLATYLARWDQAILALLPHSRCSCTPGWSPQHKHTRRAEQRVQQRAQPPCCEARLACEVPAKLEPFTRQDLIPCKYCRSLNSKAGMAAGAQRGTLARCLAKYHALGMYTAPKG